MAAAAAKKLTLLQLMAIEAEVRNDDEVKARILGSFSAGQGVANVAAEFNVHRQVVEELNSTL
jgi:hypothetical protein